MGKFDINFVRVLTYSCFHTIEAEDEDDARRKAEELMQDPEFLNEIDDNVVDFDNEYQIGEVYDAGGESNAKVGEWWIA